MFLIIASACCAGFASAFYGLWPCLFLWPPLLWYVMLRRSIRVRDIFVWTVITVTITWWSIACGLWGMAVGPWWQRSIVPAMMLCYAGVWHFLWIMLTALSLRYIRRTQFKLLVLGTSTWWYTLFVQRAVAAWVGIGESYMLHPLVAVVEQPLLTQLMLLVGDRLFWALVLAVGALAIYCISERHWYLLSGFLGLLCLVGVAGSSRINVAEQPAWVRDVVLVSAHYPWKCALEETAAQCATDLCAVHAAYPGAALFILPESSIINPYLCERWEKFMRHHDLPKVTMIMGGFRAHSDAVYNTVWLTYGVRWLACFDKQEPHAVTEEPPLWARGTVVERAFFPTTDKRVIAPGRLPRPVWSLTKKLRCTPYICSEFFSTLQPRESYHDAVILLLCNSAWGPACVDAAMVRCARLAALLWQRTIIFASQAGGAVLTSHSGCFPLSCYMVSSYVYPGPQARHTPRLH